ncbi:MAG: hypothetical protein DMF90_25505, partial [Acidobacteria bacterium]
ERLPHNKHELVDDKVSGEPDATPVGAQVMDTSAEIPKFKSVLLLDEVARLLRVSRSTIERRRREGKFPIPELPPIDSRPRWSWHEVEKFLASSSGGLRRRGQAPARRDVRMQVYEHVIKD